MPDKDDKNVGVDKSSAPSAGQPTAKAAAHDPNDIRPKQQEVRQHIVNHFKAIMDKCSQILNDPNSQQALKDEAQETYDDMVANLSKFQVKYGVNPS